MYCCIHARIHPLFHSSHCCHVLPNPDKDLFNQIPEQHDRRGPKLHIQNVGSVHLQGLLPQRQPMMILLVQFPVEKSKFVGIFNQERISHGRRIWDCLARNGAPDGCQRVTKTFALMKEVGVLPTRITFNTALKFLAKSKDEGSSRMALRILKTMENSDDSSIHPNERSYSACINAVARSSDPDRAQAAHEIYQRLEKPTTQAINGVLSACSFLPKEKQQDGVSIAIKLIDELKQRSDIFPDHITFSMMFKVIGTSMPPSKARKEIARSVFRECCKEGLLSELVIQNMKKSVTQSVFRKFN